MENYIVRRKVYFDGAGCYDDSNTLSDSVYIFTSYEKAVCAIKKHCDENKDGYSEVYKSSNTLSYIVKRLSRSTCFIEILCAFNVPYEVDKAI